MCKLEAPRQAIFTHIISTGYTLVGGRFRLHLAAEHHARDEVLKPRSNILGTNSLGGEG